MKNIYIIDGEKAVISYDPDINLLRGEFIGLTGSADFYAENVHDLVTEGSKSLGAYLTMCREKGIQPRRNYSGRFVVRLDPYDHATAVLAAASANVSLNEWITKALREAIR